MSKTYHTRIENPTIYNINGYNVNGFSNKRSVEHSQSLRSNKAKAVIRSEQKRVLADSINNSIANKFKANAKSEERKAKRQAKRLQKRGLVECAKTIDESKFSMRELTKLAKG